MSTWSKSRKEKIELAIFSAVFSVLAGTLWGVAIEYLFPVLGLVAGIGYTVVCFVFMVVCGWRELEKDLEDEWD